MNSPMDYYENLELNPDAQRPGVSAPTPVDTPDPAAVADAEIADTVIVELGDTSLTRSAVHDAVHDAVTDAVQAAVTGAVAAAVAAAVSSVSTDPQEAENRFRQKYLGLAPVDSAQGTAAQPDPDSPMVVAVPRLITDAEGAVVLQSAGETEFYVSELPAEPETEDSTGTDAAYLTDFWEEALAADQSAVMDTDEVEAVEVGEVAEMNEFVLAEPAEPAEHAGQVEAVELEVVEPEIVEALAESVKPEPVKADPVKTQSVQAPVPVAAPIIEAASAPVAERIPTATPVLEAVAVPASSVAQPASRPKESLLRDPSPEELLREEKTLQFVGFLVGTQMYAVPSVMIREVVRRQPMSRLPVDTRYVPGVINLRGLVIPLVSLRELLQAGPAEDGNHDQFSIITGNGGLCIGLAVDRIRSMYVIKQEDIVWNVSGLLGLDDETIIGLFELEERLVPIISVERIAATLQDEGLNIDGLSA